MSSAERQNDHTPECSDVRAALLHSAYSGAPAGASDALREHLAGCAACSAEYEAARALVAQLSAALAPAPLAPATRQRIENRLAAVRGRRLHAVRLVLGASGLAALAADGLLTAHQRWGRS